MPGSYRYLAPLLLAGGAYAVFPDCVNGPLRNNTICDTSAGMSQVLYNGSRRFVYCVQHRLIEQGHLSRSTL